jgi:hypothetical protein
MCQAPILQGVAAITVTFMGDAEVEDQAPAASLVSQVVPKLHVAAPLARACRDSVLGADRVSSRAEERPKDRHHPVVRLGGTCVSCARACVVAVKPSRVLCSALSKRAVIGGSGSSQREEWIPGPWPSASEAGELASVVLTQGLELGHFW